MAPSGQDKKIGLLGGSFNPAHDGHVYISKQALELLGLDEIWWLVSPQNPLKETSGMTPFDERLARAKEVAGQYNKITASDFENHSKTTYTYDTLSAIKTKYPNNNFIWLMGADNLLQFPKWHRWREIMEITPIAVFNRDNCKEAALSGEVALKFAGNKVNNPKELVYSPLPAWTFLDIEPNPLSSTQLRREQS